MIVKVYFLILELHGFHEPGTINVIQNHGGPLRQTKLPNKTIQVYWYTFSIQAKNCTNGSICGHANFIN